MCEKVEGFSYQSWRQDVGGGGDCDDKDCGQE